jgi:hypothetical protein
MPEVSVENENDSTLGHEIIGGGQVKLKKRRVEMGIG